MRQRKSKTLEDAYLAYVEKCKKENKEIPPRKEYKQICESFNKKVIEKALEGFVVHLPHYMGTLWVKKYKVNLDKLVMDMKATVEARKTDPDARIYHLNDHSGGFNCRWLWSRDKNRTHNIHLYSFKATRKNKRDLAALMKIPHQHKRYFS